MNVYVIQVVVMPVEAPASKALAPVLESKKPGPLLWKWTGRLVKVIGVVLSAVNLAGHFPIA